MNDEYYHLLVYKKLREGPLTEVDTVQLEDWLHQSPENRKAAFEIEVIWKSTSPAHVSPEGIRDELAALKARIQREKTYHTAVLSRKRTFRQWMAAAILIVVSGAIWFFTGPNKTKNEHLTFASHDSINQMLQLPDSSFVWLNKNSVLRYPPAFNRQERRVSLVGEAYFDIKRDSTAPFVVETGELQTRALGTSFYIRALPTEKTSEVTVVSGKVLVKSPKIQVEINPGEKIRYDRVGQILDPVVPASDTANTWHEELLFQNAPLREVFARLTRLHGATFSIENPALTACVYSAYFPKNNLETILSNIETVFDCKIEKTNNFYRVLGGRCM